MIDKSTSIPATNNNMMTDKEVKPFMAIGTFPSLEKKKALISGKYFPRNVGPNSIPANSSPTTNGILNCLKNSPIILDMIRREPRLISKAMSSEWLKVFKWLFLLDEQSKGYKVNLPMHIQYHAEKPYPINSIVCRASLLPINQHF